MAQPRASLTRCAESLAASATDVLRAHGRADADLWLGITRATLRREVPPLALYATVCRALPRRERSLLQAVCAYSYAKAVAIRQGLEAPSLRAATRAERRCRAAGLRIATALARSFRRRLAWNLAPTPLAGVLYRSYRVLLSAGVHHALWNAVGDVIDWRYREGRLPRPQAALAAALLLHCNSNYRIQPSRARILFKDAHRARVWKQLPDTTTHLRVVSQLIQNRFFPAQGLGSALPEKTRPYFRALTLGLLDLSGGAPRCDALPMYGHRAHMVAAYETLKRGELAGTSVSEAVEGRETRIEGLVAAVWRGEVLPAYLRDYLARQIREESSWAVRLVISVFVRGDVPATQRSASSRTIVCRRGGGLSELHADLREGAGRRAADAAPGLRGRGAGACWPASSLRSTAVRIRQGPWCAHRADCGVA